MPRLTIESCVPSAPPQRFYAVPAAKNHLSRRFCEAPRLTGSPATQTARISFPPIDPVPSEIQLQRLLRRAQTC